MSRTYPAAAGFGEVTPSALIKHGFAAGTVSGVAIVQRKYDDELIWQAMREAGLSIDDVKVRNVYAVVDDERPSGEDASFSVTFEWTAPHDVALQILQRARTLEGQHPVAVGPKHSPANEQFD